MSRSRKKSELDVAEQTQISSEISSPKHQKQKQDLESGEAFIAKPPEKSVRDQIYNIFQNGWRQIQTLVSGKPEEIITVQEIIKGEFLLSDGNICEVEMACYEKISTR